MTTEFSIIRNDEAIAVTVEWTYWPEVRGAPCDPPELEFRCAFAPNGDDIDLTREEIKAAEGKAWKRLNKGRA